ncbi:zinc finger BED domain-containing protein RICESLEEPER 2-like protein [Tanacetum coccineum]|uniref:Zinc finger BED domain-containing protein RICESLEEPER 2-like protein n=1 Tax=Tanacetum coccineum TaxID=301880 RepID=A0ABQ5B324_9ASTR
MDLKWQLALLSMRTKKFFQKTGRKITINGSDTARYDKSKVECFNYHKLGHFTRECRGPRNQDNRSRNQDSSRRTINVEEISSKAMLAIDGAGFDWSFMADEEVPIDMALMAFSDSEVHNDKTCSKTCLKIFETLQTQLDDLRIEFNKSEFNMATYKRGLASVEEQLVFYKNNELKKLKQEKESNQLKIEYFDNASKSLDKLIGSQIPNKSRKGLGFVSYNVVPPPPIRLFSPLNLDLSNSGLEEFQQPDFEGYGPKTSKSVSEDTSNEVRESPNALLVEELVSNDKQKQLILRGQIQHTLMRQCATPCVNAIKASECSRHKKGDIPNLSDFKNLIEDMLHLGEEPKEEDLLVFFLASKDETSGILKSFITQIENLVDKKVKIIRYDNGTEFKNRVMSKFCKKKGIKREFSVARTPQQNGIAERRNRTLIEVARTMLADSKLPTTFWAEAINTACYVQNMVLVVKPYNKTPYELFRGRTPSLCFIKPFRCHVTILNTLDHLGKFDGKFDNGFFVGYSLNSKAFRVYNIRTRKVEENLHVRFLEDKLIIAGDGLKWLFNIDVLTKSMNYVSVIAGTNSNDSVGTEESASTDHSSEETGSSQDYILMPLWKDGSLFDSSSKDASNDEPQPSNDAGKKDDEGGIDDQERTKNSAQDVNTTGPSINTASINFNTSSLNINTVSLTVPTAPLESTYVDFFGDEPELDLSNIAIIYPVPTTPNTRIHKDHSLDHVFGDVQSGVQTRRMINEQGFISVVYEVKNHEDLHTCLLACFLSQEESKKVYKNKKDERGIVIRNKARLVAHGYTQEEGINYDEVFAPVARIEAIRLFLAYASFKDFVVYQMDVKSAFLYGKIEKEDYVCQPPGFEDLEFPDKVYKVEKALYGLHQALRACQDKYVDEILKKFGFSTVKTASTPMETSKLLFKDAKSEDVIFQVTPKVSHLHVVKRIFRYLKDRKSTIGGCQFLGRRLILWQCKKQTIVVNSTAEAKYVAAASCCGQVLWIQNQMLDYGYNFMNTKIFIDNESTICIVKNPVFYSNTKHIEIRHHFIRDSNEKKLIQMIKIHIDHNIIDLLTKAFDVGRFQYLIASIRMLNPLSID